MALVLLCITPVFAGPITFEYKGTVNYVQDDPFAHTKAPASVGDLVVFTYTFQSDAKGSSISPWRTSYNQQGPLTATIYHGGTAVASWLIPDISIVIADNFPTYPQGYVGYDDSYEVRGSVPDPVELIPFAVGVGLGLLNHDSLYPPEAITSTSLPLDPLDLALFPSKGLYLTRSAAVPLGGGVYSIVPDWYISATIESGYEKVPEPITFLLLIMGVVGLAGVGRRFTA
jgi:hypothetical protein